MKKRIFSTLLCLYIAVGVLSAPVVQARAIFDGGDGSAEAPYLISNANQIFYLAEQVNAGNTAFNSAHYRLTADVDLGGDFAKKPFIPIGSTPKHSFQGVFDGNWQSICNLYVNDKEQSAQISYNYNHGLPYDTVYAGLFGVLDGGTVKNLTLDGWVYGLVIGGLVGWSHNGTVINCQVNCTITPWTIGRMGYAGGIVGLNDSGKVENSSFTGRFGHPIVGLNQNSGNSSNCFTPGDKNYTSKNSNAIYINGEGEYKSVEDTTDLLYHLNAWVSAQESKTYRQWTSFPISENKFENHFQVSNVYPVLADYFVRVELETGNYLPLESNHPFSLERLDYQGGLVLSGFSSVYPSMASAVAGASRTFFIRPNEGYRLYDVSADDVRMDIASPCTLASINADHTLRVRFVREGNMAHFTESTPYVGYTDVDENAWYGMAHEKTVQRVTAFGLFKGVGDGNFAPDAEITLAEAVKLAATIRSIYRGDKYPFDQPGGTHWYDNYVEYAVECGIINATDFDNFSRPATRAEMAYVLCRALPNIERTQRSSLSPPDMSNGDLYYSYVSSLYLAGVLYGSDSIGTFRPQAYISRAETAAIVARLVMQSK